MGTSDRSPSTIPPATNSICFQRRATNMRVVGGNVSFPGSPTRATSIACQSADSSPSTSDDEVFVSMQNLARLELIDWDKIQATITVLGRELLRAVSD